MKIFYKLLFLLMATHCFADEQAQILKIDNEHFLLRSGTNAIPYLIHASPKIFIDASQYTFEMPAQIRGKPLTEICLVGAMTNIYVLDWESGKTRYELSKTTLHPSDESPIFNGFKTGQTWTIAISADYETNKSLTAWYGTIEVQ